MSCNNIIANLLRCSSITAHDTTSTPLQLQLAPPQLLLTNHNFNGNGHNRLVSFPLALVCSTCSFNIFFDLVDIKEKISSPLNSYDYFIIFVVGIFSFSPFFVVMITCTIKKNSVIDRNLCLFSE